MELENLINENLICCDLEAENKTEVLVALANVAHENKKLACNCSDFEDSSNCDAFKGYLNSLLERERHDPTAVGFSYGIPHGKCKEVKEPFIMYANLAKELAWSEDENVSNVFMIGVPDKGNNDHIEILVKLSTSILDDDFRAELDKAVDKKGKFAIIKEYSEKPREF